MRPIIGLTSYLKESSTAVNTDYINSVTAAGGIPFILPVKSGLAEEYINALDGILFTGGGDIQGKYFNQPTSEKASGISEERDAYEIELARLAFNLKKPVMAICRGEQVVNAALGGDLIQHMDGHDQKDGRNVATHYVDIVPGTKIHSWLKSDKIKVNSFHHQNVDRLADGFIVSARSPEGLIEAYEYAGDWFCACYQWHPEAMLTSPEHIIMLEIFKPFIEVCRK